VCHPEIPEGVEAAAVATEEVTVIVPGGDEMPCLLSLPENSPGPGVLVITDFFGRSPFYEHIAGRLAQAGCVAILPEPFFREGPLEEHSSDFARARVRGWDQERALGDFGACIDYLRGRKEVSRDRIGTVGFCLGGTFVLYLAAERDDLASVCFYGNPGTPPGPPRRNALPPLTERTAAINGPALGIWGDADKVVDMSGVYQFGADLAERDIDYEQIVYPGLGHGFIASSGLDAEHPDYELACEAWTKAIDFLRASLSLDTHATEEPANSGETNAERDRQILENRKERMTHPGITDATRPYAKVTEGGGYIVGGLELDRPFKVRRLGHFGLNSRNIEESARFYSELLGFTMSDVGDLSFGLTSDELKMVEGPPAVYFLRHKADHHSLVLQNRSAREAIQKGRFSSEMTVNQLAWQLGSLSEITDAIRWFEEIGQPIIRTGRDLHGALYHTYLPDPEGTPNELFYGMEQIGWDSRSLPEEAHRRLASFAPPILPRPSHFDEVEQVEAMGIDLSTGYRQDEHPPPIYDVSGVLLPRPFRVIGIGPVRFFVRDVDQVRDFYTKTLGFEVTEVIEFRGHLCTYLRCRDEHHSVALYPLELRKSLPVDQGLTCLSIGMRVADYSQLRDARDFLAEKGVPVVELPPEISPGMDYAFHVLDPDGHCLEFHHRMERVERDGRPSSDERLMPATGEWPPYIPGNPDIFAGEVFMGPWG
jgi:dienelactone hydrolase/catechol 2,3-dioxygenase-like lactoylglutathione lyase family enzyme